MDFEASLKAYLAGYAGLSALRAGRIYPLILPQNPTLPAQTYQLISAPREYIHNADAGHTTRARVQIDNWGASYGDVKALATQTKAALDRFTGVMGGAGGVRIIGVWLDDETDFYEPEPAQYRVSQDFLFEY